MASSSEKLNLFVFGKKGVGKSSTGNTILKEIELGQTCLKSCESGNEININVVESPCSTNLKELKKLNETLLTCREGYHALIFVVSFTSGFNKEDNDTLKFLKSIFREGTFARHVIIVVTKGEELEKKKRLFPTFSFETWCENQDKIFQGLLKEVDRRVVLFYNNIQDSTFQTKRTASVGELLKIAKTLFEKNGIFKHDGSLHIYMKSIALYNTICNVIIKGSTDVKSITSIGDDLIQIIEAYGSHDSFEEEALTIAKMSKNANRYADVTSMHKKLDVLLKKYPGYTFGEFLGDTANFGKNVLSVATSPIIGLVEWGAVAYSLVNSERERERRKPPF